MRCRDCDAPAIYAPRSHGVRIGFCETHLREAIASFSKADALEQLEIAVATEEQSTEVAQS